MTAPIEQIAHDTVNDYMRSYPYGDLKRLELMIISALRQSCGQQPAVAGYKLVPIEPTHAMQEAGYSDDDGDRFMVPRDVYAAMLAAAPTPPVQQPCEWACAKCGYHNNGVVCTKCGWQPAPPEKRRIPVDEEQEYQRAIELVVGQQKASTSFVQRKCMVSFNRAARIIERMEQEGIVSKSDAEGRRTVLRAAPHPVRGGEHGAS